MFELKTENLKHTPNSFARARINAHLSAENSSQQAEDIFYIPVDGFVIGEKKEVLITDYLNYCCAVGIEAQEKIFLAHFSQNKEEAIPSMVKTIKGKFDINKFNENEIKVKIWIGNTEAVTNSIDSILLLLHKLNLLMPFIKELQKYILEIA